MKRAKHKIKFNANTNNDLVVSRRLVLNGKWSLTADNDLEYRISASRKGEYGESILFKGVIREVAGSYLSFSVKQVEGSKGSVSSNIKLTGRWQADRNNRITFLVFRGKSSYDSIKFQGAWEVDKKNSLIYRYSKKDLKTGTRNLQTLIFKGFWELGKNRLIYRVEGRSDSSFSFKAALQTRSIRARSGAIKYQVGIIYSQSGIRKTRRQTITIFGVWKLGRDLSLEFAVKYYGRDLHSISFGISKLVWKDGKLKLSLKSIRGRDLGLELECTKQFSNDSELFLALAHSARESKVVGGLQVRF